MGRAKVKLELISKEKPRMSTFKKRKQGLFTKLHQLTTLCDVNACIIVYGPRQEHGALQPEIWPQNPDQVRKIIGLYEAKNRGKGSSSFGLSDFFHERKRRIEEEIGRLRRENMAAKSRTPISSLNSMTEVELRELGALLSNKVEIVKSRIEFLKGNRRGGLMNQNQSPEYFNVVDESTAAMADSGVFNYPIPAVEQYSVPPVPLPPLHMQCAPLMGVAPPPQLYLQCFGMGGVAPPQMQYLARENNYENDDGGLEDILLQCAAGMGGVAPPLYLQCAGMDVVGPPPLQFLSSGEINYGNNNGGLEDIFQLM